MNCTKCGRLVDPRGATDEYCECVCRWPIYTKDGHEVRGCGAPIYFLINMNETPQPFDKGGTGGPHHATCPAYKEWKKLMRAASGGPPEIACPRCGRLKARHGACRSCGWRPGQNPRPPAIGLERFL
jgi:hypothetical protein